MALVRRLVELGRSARATSSVRTRQPLSRALVGATGWHGLSADLRAEVASELNVETLEGLGEQAVVHVAVKPNFRALGKRFGNQTQAVAAAVTAADPDRLAAQLRAGSASVDAAGLGVVEVVEDDVIITETPHEGWAVAVAGGETVALDLEITPALLRAGLAREAVRLIQDARKAAGLDVSDRIRITWASDDADMAAALEEHAAGVAAEVLALTFERGPGVGAAQVDDPAVRVWLTRAET
jgi:isoleucyl-tRNA synthetase